MDNEIKARVEELENRLRELENSIIELKEEEKELILYIMNKGKGEEGLSADEFRVR